LFWDLVKFRPAEPAIRDFALKQGLLDAEPLADIQAHFRAFFAGWVGGLAIPANISDKSNCGTAFQNPMELFLNSGRK
jgi:hypothetical protein